MDGAWGPEDEITRDLGGQPARWREEPEELERLDRLELTTLVSSGLAHDLNTPLAAMQIELGTLARHLNELEELVTAAGEMPPKVAASLTRARRSTLAIDDVAEYMTRLVRDFAKFARGRRTVRGTTDVKAALDTAVRFSHGVVAHRATLALKVPRALMAAVAEGTLVRVLLNVIINAAEAFGRADTVKNEIVITAERQNGKVVIEVSDNGAGIAPETLAHLFEPFRSGKRGGRGLGLGLAVSRSLLREAGGDLELVETGPVGTRFRCTVPAVR